MANGAAHVTTDEKASPIHSGTPENFEAIYPSYLDLVYGVVHRFCCPRSSEFEDYFQEALIALWQAIRSFDPQKGNAKTFLATCMRRKLANYLKTERRRHPVVPFSLDAQPEDGDGLHEKLKLPSIDVEATVIGREEIKSLLASLTPLEMTCALLFAEGFSYDEVAKNLGITMKSVDNALRRARQKAWRLFSQ